jgi:hypothetical protein
MSDMFKSVRRTTLIRALLSVLLATGLGGCDGADRLTSTSDQAGSPVGDANTAPGVASFATSFRGGIPFGVFHLPPELYGTTYNGSLANISPEELLTQLATARRTGTRVMLSMVGSESNFIDADGHFSMSMWKRRVDRYRGLDLSSYIQDGTIIGHYIMDEPHDATNWGGRVVSRSDIDEMARYSKQFWPSMLTIIRGKPDYLKGYSYKYLDAAWAQYLARFGSISTFISSYAQDAKASGLALVVGLNQLAGGTVGGLTGYVPDKYAMTASQLETWGNALLAEPSACAFISWKYDAKYMGRADVKAVMARLADKARNHTARSCRALTAGAVVSPPSATIVLTTRAFVRDGRHHSTLTWSGASGAAVDVYRNGARITSTPNDGTYTNAARYVGSGGSVSYAYRVCQTGSSTCSNTSTTTFTK